MATVCSVVVVLGLDGIYLWIISQYSLNLMLLWKTAFQITLVADNFRLPVSHPNRIQFCSEDERKYIPLNTCLIHRVACDTGLVSDADKRLLGIYVNAVVFLLKHCSFRLEWKPRAVAAILQPWDEEHENYSLQLRVAEKDGRSLGPGWHHCLLY